MESQVLEEQPPRIELEPFRPQSEDVNVISSSSRVVEVPPSVFLRITLCLGFSSWLISLVSQAILAATIRGGNATVRLLWFGIVIQFILLVEILEVVISRNAVYGVQISIFAGLVTVFAVLGVDQNIYASLGVQKAIGVGWLITAIINLLWIIYFTSPPDSHFMRLASNFRPFSTTRPFSGHSYKPQTVEKILKSQDAFVMSPPNGSSDAGPGAEMLKEPPLGTDEYDTLAPGDANKLKGERMRGSERGSGYDLDNIPPRRGSRTHSGALWSNYTRSSQHEGHRSSGVTDGAQGGEKEASALGSERDTRIKSDSGNLTPETPTHQPPQSKAVSRPVRLPTQAVSSIQPPPNEPIAQWKAEALFDYPGATDDPNELSFKKGEHLAIMEKSGKWWEAKNMNGKKGIVPSNYLRLLI